MQRFCQPNITLLVRFFLILLLGLLLHPAGSVAQTSMDLVEEKKAPTTVDVMVTVSSSGKTVEEARKKAILAGERQAFYKALVMLSKDKARDIYRSVRNNNLDRYVQSFTVTREVEKPDAFEADIVYRFHHNLMDGLVAVQYGMLGQDLSTPEGDGLLIISVLRNDDVLLTFQEGNQWRSIMNNVALEVGQGLLITPFGDPRDMALLSDEVLIAAEKESLMKVARRYGTRNIVIVTARVIEPQKTTNPLVVEVGLRKVGESSKNERIVRFKALSPDETHDVLFSRAAREICLQLRASLKDYSLFADEDAEKIKPLVIRAEFRSGRQWRTIQKMLLNIEGVESKALRALSPDFAQMTMMYRGTSDPIKQSLLAQGLEVNDSKEYWVVRLPE
ncbi:MAG: DUF2066 domain-containing protein [Alphaproteobacteria bacterium]|nr:MAG: DUF2066 domain-containing protein [Alphaproteobacteria bacterium]